MDTIKLLVVDDEAGMRQGVLRSLKDFVVSVDRVGKVFSLETLEAGSAEEAEAAMETFHPDLMLLDHKLPGMSGIELMTKLSGVDDAPLIVMITAYATIETAIQATKKGAYDFLPKPFTPAELRSTVAKAAEHSILSKEAEALARERRQIRFQFISILAHELKAPLNAVQSFVDILADQELSKEDQKTLMGRCSIRLQYMRKMIGDLLDLTYIESGQKKREIGNVDLTELAKEAIETVRMDADIRSISLHLDATDIRVGADRNEMEIVLNNLITNAIKYNRDGGEVFIEIKRRNGDVTIVVRDTGIGMSREESQRLFEDFVRIRNDKTRSIPGSGLGLSIVKKIAQLNYGDVAVESEPDVGSIFTVTLRLQEFSF